jgi:hypothetical protein
MIENFKTSQDFDIVFSREYKLINTSWEKQIIVHFINTYWDPKVNESMRALDLEYIEKYYLITENKNFKDDMLYELVRSAASEQARVINQKFLNNNHFQH